MLKIVLVKLYIYIYKIIFERRETFIFEYTKKKNYEIIYLFVIV